MLIAVPIDDCGCGMHPLEVARTALKRGLDVVIVTVKATDETAKIQKAKLPADRVALITDADAAVVKRFSPERGVGAALVRSGRITHQIKGNLPQNFFEVLEKEAE